MRNLTLLAVLLTLASTVFAEVVDVPPSKQNCSLVSPPLGTKGKGSHLGIIFGYPETVPNNFTGCHHLWIAEDEQGLDWGLKMTTYFSNGIPHLYVERLQEVGRGVGEIQLACSYDGESLVSEQIFQVGVGRNISKCPAVQTLKKSFNLKARQGKMANPSFKRDA